MCFFCCCSCCCCCCCCCCYYYYCCCCWLLLLLLLWLLLLLVLLWLLLFFLLFLFLWSVFFLRFSSNLQWEILATSLPSDIDAKYSTACHNGQLYVSSHSKASGSFIKRSQDLVSWEELPCPISTMEPSQLLSHRGKLYCLGKSERSARDGSSSCRVLFQLNDSMSTASAHIPPQCPGSTSVVWQQLPSGQSLTRIDLSAWFGVGDSLLLAGGVCGHQVNTSRVVHEYSISRGKWVMPSTWPDLEQPRQSHRSVVLDDAVHLIGGLRISFQSGDAVKFSPEIQTMKIADGGRGVGWKTNRLAPSPHGSPGACRLFETVVLAGGFKIGARNENKADVYVWNRTSHRWLALPPLNKPRDSTSLIAFQGKLLAFGGGCEGNKYLATVEQLSI